MKYQGSRPAIPLPPLPAAGKCGGDLLWDDLLMLSTQFQQQTTVIKIGIIIMFVAKNTNIKIITTPPQKKHTQTRIYIYISKNTYVYSIYVNIFT